MFKSMFFGLHHIFGVQPELCPVRSGGLIEKPLNPSPMVFLLALPYYKNISEMSPLLSNETLFVFVWRLLCCSIQVTVCARTVEKLWEQQRNKIPLKVQLALNKIVWYDDFKKQLSMIQAEWSKLPLNITNTYILVFSKKKSQILDSLSWLLVSKLGKCQGFIPSFTVLWQDI